MKYLYVIAAAVALTGCAGSNPLAFNNTEVVVQTQYVVRTAPDQLKTLPPLPPALANPRTATSAQIATWINNTEQYAADLESMIQTLVNFYEAPVSTTEAGNLQAVTPRAAAQPNGRVIQAQTTAGTAETFSSAAPSDRRRLTTNQRIKE